MRVDWKTSRSSTWPGERSHGRHAFNCGVFYRNSRLCQSGTICRAWHGHPFRSVFIGCNALGDDFRQTSVPGVSRRVDGPPSAYYATLRKIEEYPEPIIALLDVLLAKDPSQRIQNPAQLRKAITRAREAIASGSKLTAAELRSDDNRATENLAKGKLRKRAVRRLLGASLGLAVALAAWFFYSPHFGPSNQGPTAAAPTDKSIAVLPFDNISPNKEDAYFADGVQDEI
jgi:hypothetical protein